ncbi:bifunctional aspartate kinase/homoserine dehydrogenase I [Tenacibaculum finnmarkense]|uniref:bifunctional aspartate kinase/homoserine dehydrogenase I n=1 Tax=Tenacibaculum finnmarkense TaxID=2781243 RepID=UPI001EFB5BF1|nr:bifunctional aspartate kinase/homoserine dehydrogenase I [Tenacibaculum finnmarkense]MCG8235891.1 bifunctional aspartate kinase/homoserine dehydrogenase I [Tenacibaculum finnmarkense genomovar ulcerans]MCG8829778.1 bifunctional aspartate kinase/homoserine dehydrogenase I [Tenacibaculum finnmarkense]
MLIQQLLQINITNFTTENGLFFDEIPLSYEVFGKKIGTAPMVLINHALTGNSNVANSKNGWWKDLIGKNKAINTANYTVLCFNIPGNGYDGFLIENYKNFIARDIAKLFLKGLEKLKITQLFALIGGSLGGGIAWEMVVLNPVITQKFIPIATDWKATDWLIANCQIQEQFLVNSKNPVHDARMHAMLCYRTPKSFKERFHRSKKENSEIFNVESWLLHHSEKLQERYQLASYKLMNQLLKTIDVTKNSNENRSENKVAVLEKIQADIHIIGVDSDLFFTAEENRETQKELALVHDNVTYNEINSVHGHDAFLMEYEQLEKIISPIFNPKLKNKNIKIIKFGGKSLSNNGISNVISIIEEKINNQEKIAVVVSARGNATNQLEEILEKSAKNENYQQQFEAFKFEQSKLTPLLDFSSEFTHLEKLFEGVFLLGDFSPKIKDEILAQGELLSAKTVTELLTQKGISAKITDARKLIKTAENFGNAQPIIKISKENVQKYFKKNNNTVTIVTGFIASNLKGETTTLGRNGSNYTASLLANFLNADELQNYTHVDGIFTANPDLVADAKKIETLSFSEANELANFGATILHAKTISPLLEKNINLRILNTFKPNDSGTLITSKTTSKGIKSIAVLDNVALLNFEGRGLLGKVGVDARIFKALSNKEISVSIVSQGSSERGIGLVIDKSKSEEAIKALEQEFESDFYTKDVHQISIIADVSVISIIGQDLSEFHHSYNALIKNQIVPLLFNNTISGKNVSLVVKKQQLHKALNVIHGQVFGVAKKINIAIFGKGLVGGTLINQIIENTKSVLERNKIQLNIFAVSGSKKLLLNEKGIDENWEIYLENSIEISAINTVIDFAKQHHLENLIAVDNTASHQFIENYTSLIKAGFDLVSSNKIANTVSHSFYKKLRDTLAKNSKSYLYETNVGAGLPLIDTIKLLHDSGENITKIRGVFSGSLSYLFNTFSSDDVAFSEILQKAIDKGFTEPDPREDLCGNDVARKLLILARELDLENELEDIVIENLIPTAFRESSSAGFLSNLKALNTVFQQKKEAQKPNHVLRYIGDLSGDLSKEKGNLTVKLVSVPTNSVLGSLKGSDVIFEIYTESYGEKPIVIQGAGAGAKVTARGVFGDILRLAKNH